MSYIIIDRYGIPTELDQFPYGTQCKVSNHHHNEYDLYLQVSDDEDNPEWDLLGTFTTSSNQFEIEQLMMSRLRKNVRYG